MEQFPGAEGSLFPSMGTGNTLARPQGQHKDTNLLNFWIYRRNDCSIIRVFNRLRQPMTDPGRSAFKVKFSKKKTALRVNQIFLLWF